MSGFSGLGIRTDLIEIRDRDSGLSHAVHSACADRLADMIGQDEFRVRFFTVGPTVADGCMMRDCGVAS
jgi:hypothetical protein